MRFHHLQLSVRVTMHLNEGYTRVLVECTEGKGLADGGIAWDIPTASIAYHLRHLGSRFLVVTDSVWVEEQDTIEELREACSKIAIEEFGEANDTVLQ
jgi:hypothetical protein